MALTSISLKNGATMVGRMLARNGQVSLINDVLTAPECASGPAPPGSGTPTSGETDRRRCAADDRKVSSAVAAAKSLSAQRKALR